jgi:hypothetical protein
MRLAVFALLATAAMADTPPIADENLRLAALHAIFPGMQIALMQGVRIDDSWPKNPKAGELYFPDALATENVYRVVGKTTNEIEREASEDVASLAISTTRIVRLQLFRWPGAQGLLAVLQYRFDGVYPALSYQSMALLAQISQIAGTWQVGDRRVLETIRHRSLQAIQLRDLGHGADELIIESDLGGPGTIVSELLIFNLGASKFVQVLRKPSRFSGFQGTWTETLDIPKTLDQRGAGFCFTKTISVENDVTHPCYKRGEGMKP